MNFELVFTERGDFVASLGVLSSSLLMTRQNKNHNYWGLDCEDKSENFAGVIEKSVHYETKTTCKMRFSWFGLECHARIRYSSVGFANRLNLILGIQITFPTHSDCKSE